MVGFDCPICGDEEYGYYAHIWSIATIPVQLERVIIAVRKITPNILEGKIPTSSADPPCAFFTMQEKDVFHTQPPSRLR
ncbi:hypothetical protein N7455_011478 [Penicillium solitum]|uniref:uncharacterized protein n=1 Tax=Penicillium solitum TaxID=60172 RepID=UPI0017938509|nr:hypothetical protein HAV15_009711 [Penicillium sp. str. \